MEIAEEVLQWFSKEKGSDKLWGVIISAKGTVYPSISLVQAEVYSKAYP